jgi:hypothetical protein
MLRALLEGDRLFSWAVRTDDIDAIAARTGRKPKGGTITSPDGATAPGWRIVAPAEAAAWLPFFIHYAVDRAREMERMRERYNEVASPAQPGGIAWIEIAGDEAALRDWLREDLPVRVVGGAPGPRAVGIESARGEIVVR